jgi:hypothetical protein
LMDYNARYYDPWLGRFVNADTVVPNPGAPKDLNRYAYAGNNPVRYTDPTGHYLFEEEPDDPQTWRWDKPGNTNTLIRSAEEVVFWEETREPTVADLLTPFGALYGGAAVGVLGEAVVAEVGTTVIETVGSVVTAACTDTDCTNEVASAGKVTKQAGTTVLGHFPEYVNKARELGANYFNIPSNTWNKMTDAERWAANKQFLDEALARGDRIVLATALDAVRPGTFLEREITYLKELGYTFVDAVLTRIE